jgi:S1-C subfamily serine protease
MSNGSADAPCGRLSFPAQLGDAMTHVRLAASALIAAGVMLAAQALAQIPFPALGQDVPSLAPLLKVVSPSVVSIAVRRRLTAEERAALEDAMPEDPLASPGLLERDIYAAGSGVIIDADQGFIITGSHVVEGANEMAVILSDGRRLVGTTVGADEQTDIAVVKVRASGLTSIMMGDSDRVEVGDFVLAIGNPFSLGQTVTWGIISALRRRSWGPQTFEDYLQTDAAINLGSSGGALVNLRGELVGMNAAILDTGDPNGGNAGIGFAIPVNIVRSIATQLTRYGSASHGYLGATVSLAAVATLNAPSKSGVAIMQIERQSAAALADLRIGDIITMLNQVPVRDPADLYIRTAMLRVGEVVALDILRNGLPISVHATLGAATKGLGGSETPLSRN